jgi:hypothetical protein
MPTMRQTTSAIATATTTTRIDQEHETRTRTNTKARARTTVTTAATATIRTTTKLNNASNRSLRKKPHDLEKMPRQSNRDRVQLPVANLTSSCCLAEQKQQSSTTQRYQQHQKKQNSSTSTSNKTDNSSTERLARFRQLVKQKKLDPRLATRQVPCAFYHVVVMNTSKTCQ